MARRAEQYIIPPTDFILVASGTVGAPVALPTNTRGLLIGGAGTIDVTMVTGNAPNGLPVLAGIFPGFFISVDASTATNIWAII